MQTQPKPYGNAARAGSMLLAGMLLITLSGLSCDKPAKPVAKIAGNWVGQPQWQAYLRGALSSTSAEALHGLVRREVAWEQSGARGLLSGEEWESFLKTSRRAILARAYLNTLPGEVPFTEAQAKAHFISSAEERHVLHVLCKTKPEAERAFSRIKLGGPFEKIADALSKDPSVVRNHGDLGWIKRGRMVPPFEDAVFALKVGEVAGPFETEFGWHVAQVREIKPPTDEDFSRSKGSIMREMADATQAMKRPGAVNPLQTEFPLVLDKDVLGFDRTTVPAPGDEQRVAGRVGGATISLKELKQFMGDYLRVSGASHGLGPETKGKFMELIADDIRLALAAEKAGVDKRPEVQAEIWEAQRRAAFGAFSKTYLVALKVPDLELKAHYDSHPERFGGPGAVKLNLLAVDQPTVADLAMADAKKGVPWKTLFEKYANKASTGAWDAGWVEVEKLQTILPKEAIQAMLNRPLDRPIGPVPGPEGLMLFKVLERKPGPIMAFNSCREAVREDYLKDRGAGLVDEYLGTEGRKGISLKEFPENASIQKEP